MLLWMGDFWALVAVAVFVLALVGPFLPYPKPPRRLVRPGNRSKHFLAHPTCEYVTATGLACGAPSVTVHHKRFRSAGGGDDDGNLCALCDRHHKVKHHLLPED